LAEKTVFDSPNTVRFNQARRKLLAELLPAWQRELGLKTAMDVGCGLGYFSALLVELGFDARAIEGRSENAAEARRRVPGLDVQVADAEDDALGNAGSFDLVLGLGLLYHLENPFRAIRNLFALTRRILIIDSMCVPGKLPVLHLREENSAAEDQGMTPAVFYPSEACLIKMLYRAGFASVSRPARLPDHPEFRGTWKQKKVRTMLVATRAAFASPLLVPLSEPPGWDDPWARKWRRPLGGRLRRLESAARRRARERRGPSAPRGEQ
jgi:tRNA (mo5U34)-methyltransferase